jgi:hypothetical protein
MDITNRLFVVTVDQKNHKNSSCQMLADYVQSVVYHTDVIGKIEK